MKTLVTLLCISLVIPAVSCRNKNPNLSREDLLTELNKEPEKPKEVEVMPEGYVPPAGIKYMAKRDFSEPLKHLDVIAGLKNEQLMKLSSIAKEIVYHRIGTFEYGIRPPFVPVGDGYMIKGDSGIWLLNKDFKKERLVVREDAEIKQEGKMMMYIAHVAVHDFFVDPVSRLFYCLQLRRPKKERAPYERSVSVSPIDPILQSDKPVDLATINNRVVLGMASIILPIKDGFALSGVWINGLYTFNSKGDSLCHFVAGSNPFEELKGTVRNPEDSNAYLYDGSTYYRQAYTDTVFRLKDASTFQPVYKIDLGPYQTSRTEGMKISVDLSDKYLLDNLTETDDWLFLRITKNYDCPSNRDSKSVTFYQLMYNKRSGQLSSFQDQTNLSMPGSIPNDLDGGIGFWPGLQINGKPYMLVRGENLKKNIPKDRLDKIEALQGLEDKEMILITIK